MYAFLDFGKEYSNLQMHDWLLRLSQHCGPSFCVVGRCCLWGFFSVNWYYVNQFLGKILNSLVALIELFHQTEPEESS